MERALKVKDALVLFLESAAVQEDESLRDVTMTAENWAVLQVVVDCLRLLYDVAAEISGEK